MFRSSVGRRESSRAVVGGGVFLFELFWFGRLSTVPASPVKL